MIETLKVQYRKLRKFYYAYIKAWFVYRQTAKWNILDSWQTIDYLLTHKCSLSRYGDGEFSVIRGEGNGFQNADDALAQRLKDILVAEDAPNFMVGIPYALKNIDGMLRPRDFWPVYTSLYYKHLRSIINPKKLYLNSLVTRFYFESEDKSRCSEHLSKLRSLWNDQDLLIVEGDKTRSGIGNDLYDNAASVQRIIGYSENSFVHYEEMKEAILKYARKDQLILLCYGMTATVLAYDLAKLGYWAIDLGHLDVEYEWMRMGVTERALIKGKHVNELKEIGGADVDDCIDPLYKSQIICDITESEK